MNFQEVLTKDPDKAMQLFDMINKLTEDEPNSKLAVEWQAAKQSVGLDDIMGAYINQIDQGGDPSSQGGSGYTGWEDKFKDMYGPTAKPMNWAVNRVALPAAGSAVQAAGNIINAHQSILGSALGAMAPAIKPSSEYDRSGINEMTSAMLGLQGAKKIARGAMSKVATDAIGSEAKRIGAELEARNDKAREATLMMNEHPVGDFYRSNMQLRKLAQESGKK